MLVKIEFEDHGQDFLTWIIDTEKQKVIDCWPFQAAIWVGSEVTQTDFEKGGLVNFTKDFTEETITADIKYPISRVLMIPEKKPSKEAYGWEDSSGFDQEPGGWLIEGGEEAYEEVLKLWEKYYGHSLELS